MADLEDAHTVLNAFTIDLTYSGPDTIFSRAELSCGERNYIIVASGDRAHTCTA